MTVKFADEIIKDIDNRETIHVPEDCVSGEAFDTWMHTNKNNNKLESEKKMNEQTEQTIEQTKID